MSSGHRLRLGAPITGLLMLPLLLGACAAGGAASPGDAGREPGVSGPPNVVIILADDLGIGDVGAYGADPDHVRTPHIDRLAREGIRLDRTYSPAACCTPTRYSLLTGAYPFREKLADSVLPGDAPLGIRPGTWTLPRHFTEAGCSTGFVGKWHLGLGTRGADGRTELDWNGDIAPGPLETGFDEAFFMPSTGDRTPCVLVRNRRLVGADPSDPIQVSHRGKVGSEPTGKENPEALAVLGLLKGAGHDGTVVHGVSRIGWMCGGAAARWKDEDLSDTLAAEACAFIRRNRERRYFLLFAPHGIHEPKLPHPRFRGTSGCGVYGDQVHELDDAVRQILAAIDEGPAARNTLVIFTSDNGGTEWIAYDYARLGGHDLRGHRPNGALRGEKFTAYEGGTRVPFLARWPCRIAGGKSSDAMFGLVDLAASLASLLGRPLPEHAAPDSEDLPGVLLGTDLTGRRELVTTVAGRQAQFRQDGWKYIPPARQSPARLFHLLDDPTESRDLSSAEPERVRAMAARLEALMSAPRTR